MKKLFYDSGRQLPTRLFSLDVSRGVAALAVVFYHWQHFYYVDNIRPANFSKTAQPLADLFKIFYLKGHMAVEYFFLLSGFVFFWLYREPIRKGIISFSSFFAYRFSRLYPLHFVTLFSVMGLQYIHTCLSSAPFIYIKNDLYHFILNLFFVSSWGGARGASFNAPVWSVSVEILLYLIFFYIALIKMGNGTFCSLLFFLFLVLSQVYRSKVFEGGAMFFLGGATFYLTTFLLANYFHFRKYLYLCFIVYWGGVFVNIYVMNLHSYFYSHTIGKIIYQTFIYPEYLLFPITLITLVVIEVSTSVNFRLLAWLGDSTYSLYLLHFPLQILFVIMASLSVIPIEFYLNVQFLGGYFLILMVLSYVTFYYFERPAKRICRDWFRINNSAV